MTDKRERPHWMTGEPYLRCDVSDLNTLAKHGAVHTVVWGHTPDYWGPMYLVRVDDYARLREVYDFDAPPANDVADNLPF